jgi:hypothetical protein
MNKAERIAAASLSRTSKLGCFSWSLQALETCPGSIGAAACSGCYATGGFYAMPDAKALRARNKADWQAADWEARMIAALAGESHFRWFDSGDMYSLVLAEKIYAVMLATPSTKHWLPTRMGKFPKFAPILARMAALPNVRVRFSSDSVTGEFSAEHGSTIIPAADVAPQGVTVCRAYENLGKCGPCRACWSKAVDVIAYPAHGAKMLRKVIPLALAA